MTGVPTAQTRGFLFADLRGYSAFTEEHGDRAARELLHRYRTLVREVIGRYGGAEIRTRAIVSTSFSPRSPTPCRPAWRSSPLW